MTTIPTIPRHVTVARIDDRWVLTNALTAEVLTGVNDAGARLVLSDWLGTTTYVASLLLDEQPAFSAEFPATDGGGHGYEAGYSDGYEYERQVTLDPTDRQWAWPTNATVAYDRGWRDGRDEYRRDHS